MIFSYEKSNKGDFEDLKSELKADIEEDADLIKIRAKLEIIIAKELYGLNLDDWKYVCSTFTYGAESETKAELDAIIQKSIEIWKE